MVAAMIEAITWAGLLVGMYLKYISGTTEMGVWIFGRLHGAAFLAYIAACWMSAQRLQWSWSDLLLAGLAAFPPLVTVPLEISFRRRGLLSASRLVSAP